MASDWTAGLNPDDLEGVPSAARPLEQAGIDPLMARANPALLGMGAPGGAQESALPDPSVAAAARVGGAGADAGVPDQSQSQSQAQPQSGPQAQPQSAAGYGLSGLGLLQQNLQSATQAAQDMPLSDPEIARLTAQREREAVQPQLYDPQTGKMSAAVEEYDPQTGAAVTINPKPGVGTRIWRGVRGGLEGLATGGIRGALLGAIDPAAEPGDVAYGAPNAAFEHAEQARQGALAATDTGLGQAQKNWQDAVNARKAQASEFRANATLGKDQETGAEGLIKGQTDQTRAATEQQREQNQSPAAKAQLTQDQLNNRQKWVAANGAGMTPLQKTMYVLNGKVPDPKQPNEAEINAGNAARALTVFRASHNGRGPSTLDEFNQVQAAARGVLGRSGGGGSNRNTADAIQQEALSRKDKFMQGFQHMANGNWMPLSGSGSPLTPDQMRQQLDGFRTQANAQLARTGYRIDSGANGQWMLNESGAAPAARGPQPPAGATHVYKDKAGTVKGWAVNGKFVAVSGE